MTIRTCLADRSGASAFEFAAVLPPLMLLLFGTIEMGRLMWTRVALHDTTIAAARCIGVHAPACTTGRSLDTAKLVAYARSRAGRFSTYLAADAVTAVSGGTCAGVGGFATVTITSRFVSGVPLVGAVLGAIPLNFTACYPMQGG